METNRKINFVYDLETSGLGKKFTNKPFDNTAWEQIYQFGFIATVGPVDSAFDTVEAYADLSGYLVLDSDDDGWRGTTKYVETACYNPKP